MLVNVDPVAMTGLPRDDPAGRGGARRRGSQGHWAPRACDLDGGAVPSRAPERPEPIGPPLFPRPGTTRAYQYALCKGK